MKQDVKKWPNGRVMLINHRGLSPGFPENTLAAFKNSVALGVDAIELDLRGSRDGIPVVMHDPTVDRTTNGKGAVADLALTELKRLDAGSRVVKMFRNERIPTYEEALLLVSRTPVSLLLDIKLSSSLKFDFVVGLTEKHHALLRIIIGARTIDDVQVFRSLNPNLRILGLIKRRNDIKSFLNAGADIIRVWPEWIYTDDRLVVRMHKAGKPVWVSAGTATSKDLLRLIRLGANGILTDRPKTLSKVIRDIDSGAIRV
jgi:glycerophosphoryl diester phosphodiesterase